MRLEILYKLNASLSVDVYIWQTKLKQIQLSVITINKHYTKIKMIYYIKITNVCEVSVFLQQNFDKWCAQLDFV